MKYILHRPFYLWSICVVLIALTLYYKGHSTQAQSINLYSYPVLLKKSLRAFADPQDLTITQDGGYLLVADTGNNEIKILQAGTLKILGQFGEGHLKSPSCIEIDKTGAVLVVDDQNRRVTSYSFNGVHRNGTVNVKMIKHQSNLKAIQSSHKSAVDETGQLYVVNNSKNQIEIFAKSGALIGIYRAGGIKNPMAVETVGRYFWIADTGNNRILLLRAPRPLEQ